MIVRGLPFPDELFYLVDHQVWARLDGEGLATVGITSMGIRAAGEIYMCRPKPVGAELEQGRAVAVVELAKSIVSVKSPVRGRVVAINSVLESQPERMHQDPYGEGWLAQVQLADFDADLDALVHGDAVPAAMEQYAWLNQIEDGA